MEAITQPIRESEVLKKLQKSGYPAYVWGTTRCVRPSIVEAMRGNSKFTLIVTYDMARADKLCSDYKLLDKDVYVYPAKDALFYFADVHGNLTSAKRLEIIKRIHKDERTVIITTVEGLMDRLPDLKYFRKHAFSLSVGDTIDPAEVKKRLVMLGYESVPVVETRGQFSARGGIIDIYPLTEECPCRVDFFGDEVDSIRYFDETTQRSIEQIETFEILPASEYVLSDARKRRGINAIEEEGERVAEALKKGFKTEASARIRSYIKHVRDEVMEYNSTSGLDSLVTYFFTKTLLTNLIK